VGFVAVDTDDFDESLPFWYKLPTN
jgi:hypothetical protein